MLIKDTQVAESTVVFVLFGMGMAYSVRQVPIDGQLHFLIAGMLTLSFMLLYGIKRAIATVILLIVFKEFWDMKFLTANATRDTVEDVLTGLAGVLPFTLFLIRGRRYEK